MNITTDTPTPETPGDTNQRFLPAENKHLKEFANDDPRVIDPRTAPEEMVCLTIRTGTPSPVMMQVDVSESSTENVQRETTVHDLDVMSLQMVDLTMSTDPVNDATCTKELAEEVKDDNAAGEKLEDKETGIDAQESTQEFHLDKSPCEANDTCNAVITVPVRVPTPESCQPMNDDRCDFHQMKISGGIMDDEDDDDTFPYPLSQSPESLESRESPESKDSSSQPDFHQDQVAVSFQPMLETMAASNTMMRDGSMDEPCQLASASDEKAVKTPVYEERNENGIAQILEDSDDTCPYSPSSPTEMAEGKETLEDGTDQQDNQVQAAVSLQPKLYTAVQVRETGGEMSVQDSSKLVSACNEETMKRTSDEDGKESVTGKINQNFDDTFPYPQSQSEMVESKGETGEITFQQGDVQQDQVASSLQPKLDTVAAIKVAVKNWSDDELHQLASACKEEPVKRPADVDREENVPSQIKEDGD